MSQSNLRIAVGADHGAFEMKNAVVAHLREAGHEVEDFGTHTPDSVDYADYANIVSRNVADGTFDFGILACTSGVGMSISANRFTHVRAVNIRTVEETVITRQHNDANVLSLGARFLSEEETLEVVDLWLETDFSGDDRHIRRIQKIEGMGM